MKTKDRPFSLGFLGHAKICDCSRCAKIRTNLLLQRVANPAPLEVDHTKTIYVKAHFRKDSRHLSRYPNTRRLLVSRLRRLE